ncbi:MAG: hypothetical protein Q9203_005073, partial [Teloschistes exilis]
MAYHHTGNQRPAQYANQPASPAIRIPQGLANPAHIDQSSFLRRNPSFDRGDDASYRDDLNAPSQERAYGARTYRAGSNASMQYQELFMGASNPPSQTPTYAPHMSPAGYQHQDTPPAPADSQSSYNPQNYGPSQPQGTQQSPYTSQNRYSPAYQPYIPAAYQPSAIQYPLAYPPANSTSYPSPALPQHTSQPPPPPPPRPQDQR